MNKNVVDTHRLMYRNARIRALDLSDRTSVLDFYNITEADPAGVSIGNIIYTDPNGYMFYGNNAQPVGCLVVKKSAIIQVDLHNTNAWNIEWVVEVPIDTDYVTISQVGKVYDQNDNLLWDPLTNDWKIPDWVQRSEIAQGEWAEGELALNGATLALTITKWTHSIIVKNGSASNYTFATDSGRYGQVITIVHEAGGGPRTFTDEYSSESVTIGRGETVIAVHNGTHWVFSAPLGVSNNKQQAEPYLNATVTDPAVGTLIFFVDSDLTASINITDSVDTNNWMNVLVFYNGSTAPASGSKTLDIIINGVSRFSLTKVHDGSAIPAYTALFSGAYRRTIYKAQDPDDTMHVHFDKTTYQGWYTT